MANSNFGATWSYYVPWSVEVARLVGGRNIIPGVRVTEEQVPIDQAGPELPAAPIGPAPQEPGLSLVWTDSRLSSPPDDNGGASWRRGRPGMTEPRSYWSKVRATWDRPLPTDSIRLAYG